MTTLKKIVFGAALAAGLSPAVPEVTWEQEECVKRFDATYRNRGLIPEDVFEACGFITGSEEADWAMGWIQSSIENDARLAKQNAQKRAAVARVRLGVDEATVVAAYGAPDRTRTRITGDGEERVLFYEEVWTHDLEWFTGHFSFVDGNLVEIVTE